MLGDKVTVRLRNNIS